MDKKHRRHHYQSKPRDGIAEAILRTPRVEEQTNGETVYLNNLIQNRTPVVVTLLDNVEIAGWIEYYDKNFIRVTRNREPNVFVFKEKIKYISERR